MELKLDKDPQTIINELTQNERKIFQEVLNIERAYMNIRDLKSHKSKDRKVRDAVILAVERNVK